MEKFIKARIKELELDLAGRPDVEVIKNHFGLEKTVELKQFIEQTLELNKVILENL